MKTLTEFSTLTLRKAAAARAAAGGSTVSAPAAELDDAMDASDSAAEAAGDEGESPAGEGEPEAAAAEGAEPAEASPAADSGGEGEAKPDPIVEAVAHALGVQPDRAARMIEALDIVGNRLDEVRLVRVFQGE